MITRSALLALVAAAGLLAIAGCSAPEAAPVPPVSGSAAPTPESPPTASAPPPTSVSQEQRFRDDQLGYSMVPPQGWAARSGDLGGQYMTVFARPDPDTSSNAPFAVNINVMVTTSTGSLAADVGASMEQFSLMLDGYQPVDNEAVELADGHPAHLLGGTFAQQGAELRNLQLLVAQGDRLYVATGTAPAVSFEVYEPELRRSLLSFSLT